MRIQTTLIAMTMAMAMLGASVVRADEVDHGEAPDVEDLLPDAVNEAIPEEVAEIAQKIVDKVWKHQDVAKSAGVGAIVGYAGGAILKSVTRFAMVIAGGGFVALHSGLAIPAIPIGNSDHFISDATNGAVSGFDMNGDGKLDKDDAGLMWQKVQPWLARHIPLSGGLFGGFLMGFK